jgi:hypothetical protein
MKLPLCGRVDSRCCAPMSLANIELAMVSMVSPEISAVSQTTARQMRHHETALRVADRPAGETRRQASTQRASSRSRGSHGRKQSL